MIKFLKKHCLTIVTSFMLLAILLGVGLVCFLPQKVITTSGNGEYSPIYSGNKAKQQVSLMFNVYEGTEVVNGILDVLKEHNVKTTFFIGGCWADKNEETVKRIYEEGHELASHGYFHKNHKNLNENQNKVEIDMCGKLIKSITGYDMTLFAPPSGSFSLTTLKVAQNLGYKTIMWSKDTIDWRDKDKKIVYNRATKNIGNGDLVLMHPKQHTLEALPDILTYYEKVGLKVVTVSECVK